MTMMAVRLWRQRVHACGGSERLWASQTVMTFSLLGDGVGGGWMQDALAARFGEGLLDKGDTVVVVLNTRCDPSQLNSLSQLADQISVNLLRADNLRQHGQATPQRSGFHHQRETTQSNHHRCRSTALPPLQTTHPTDNYIGVQRKIRRNPRFLDTLVIQPVELQLQLDHQPP
ncbi:hypothetical protein ACLB2K_053620 [Fragaria x ananassa]